MGVTRIHIKRNSDTFELRRCQIFTEILNLYIQTAAPVGSRTIARRLRNSLSPATIRNVMADLEELGYIEHPYTSAGRVPTDQGYRYYVNALMQESHLTKDEEETIRVSYERHYTELEEIIERASRLLSEVSNQAALVLFSGVSRDIFKRIALIPLDIGSNRLLVVFISASGMVRNYKVELPEPVEDVQLERLNRLLNQELEGLPLSQIERHLKRRMMMEQGSLYYNLFKQALAMIKATILTSKEERLWLEGTSRILEQPEFKEVSRTRALLRLLEEKEPLLELLRQDLEQDQRCRIYIGSEMGNEAMKWYSLVTRSYKIGDRVIGTVGILGPTRMEYSHLVALVDRMAELLGKGISQMGEL